MTGSTKPNWRMERVSESSSASEMRLRVGGIGAQVVDGDVDDGELVISGLHLEVPHFGVGVDWRMSSIGWIILAIVHPPISD